MMMMIAQMGLNLTSSSNFVSLVRGRWFKSVFNMTPGGCLLEEGG